MTAPALREPGGEEEELVRIAKEFRDGILGRRSSFGMCAAVCWPLEGFLSCAGIRSRTEEVEFEGPTLLDNHCFLRLPDGRVLDPTADQFGLPPVYLGPEPDYQRLADDMLPPP